MHWGFKNAYTIGWDLNLDGKSHFNTNNPVHEKYVIEFKFVNDNIIDLYQYFKKNRLSINVAGKMSCINSIIPRIDINNINIIKIHGGLGDIIKQYNLLRSHIKNNEIVICVTAVSFCLKETVNTLFKDLSKKFIFIVVNDRNLDKMISNNSIKTIINQDKKEFIIEKKNSIYNNYNSNEIVNLYVNKTYIKNIINYRFFKKQDYDFMRDTTLYYQNIPITKLYNKKCSEDFYNEVVNKIGKDYILIHSRPKDNCSRDLLPINEEYFSNKDLPIYNFDFDSELNYGIKSNNILDYYDIVKKCQRNTYL